MKSLTVVPDDPGALQRQAKISEQLEKNWLAGKKNSFRNQRVTYLRPACGVLKRTDQGTNCDLYFNTATY